MGLGSSGLTVSDRTPPLPPSTPTQAGKCTLLFCDISAQLSCFLAKFTQGLRTQSLYHNALALSSRPGTEVVNLISCSEQFAGGRACSCLVFMHLQCGKSRPSLNSLSRLGSNSKHKKVVHGLSIPLGKLGFWLPRTISRSLTEDNGAAVPKNLRSRLSRMTPRLPTFSTSRHHSMSRNQSTPRVGPVTAVWRTGGTVIPAEAIPAQQDQQMQSLPERRGSPATLCDQPRGEGGTITPSMPEQETDGASTPPPPISGPAPGLTGRTIRFHDESS